MNVACTACPAKYAVPDEKVRGRKVKITCKHCGTAIVVDGTKVSDQAGGTMAGATASVAPAKVSALPVQDKPSVVPAGKATVADAPTSKAALKAGLTRESPAPKPAAAPEPEPPAAPPPEPPAEIEWIVAFSDDRQDPATTAQVVEYYAAGHIDEGTYIWREGMDDWAAPYDIPELRDALRAAGIARRSPPPPPFVGDEDEATRVAPSPLDGEASSTSSGVWREPGRVGTPAGAAAAKAESKPAPARIADEPKPALETPRPAAARKNDAPPAAAKAQPLLASKAEPSPRAAVKPGSAQRGAAALRRDRSGEVDDLFGSIAQAGSEHDATLHAESATEEAPRLTGQRNESSVLFSLDALIKTEKTSTKTPPRKQDESALLFGEPAPNSIANVGTGGIGVALAAPDFTAPVAAPPPSAPRATASAVDVAVEPAQKKRGVGWLVAVLVLGGGVAAAFALGIPQKLMNPPAPSAAPTAEPAAAAKSPAPPAETAPAAETATPTETAAPPVPSGTPEATAASAAAAAAPAPAHAEARPAEPAAPNKPPAEKPADKAPPKETPAPSADLPPFDKAAAAAALSEAAANVSSCRQPGGAMGSGRVTITFAPSGRATNTNVTGEVAGTTVGGCVARLFRSVKVPPFSGEPISVGKSFSID